MEYLNPPDLSKLFRVMYAANRTYQMVALVQLTTGARISQVLRLRGEDVFQHDGHWVIKIHSAKRGFEGLRTLRVDSDPAFDVTPLIELAARRRTSLLFGGVDRCNLNKALKRYCAKAGIHSDFGKTHAMRHSAAMHIWNQTHSLGSISAFLLHKSPASSMFYLRENDGNEAQAAMDNLVLA